MWRAEFDYVLRAPKHRRPRDGLSQRYRGYMSTTDNTAWYVRDDGLGRRIWLLDDRAATRMDVTNPKGGAGCYFEARPGEDIWTCIAREATGWERESFIRMSLAPGQYYPRIARPNALGVEQLLWSDSANIEKAHVANAGAQLNSLVRSLGSICQTVQPAEKTLDVYGHDIRNLLILAATEAEMHWRGVLVANGLKKAKYDTNDYVKLLEPMRLPQYTVAFSDFPDLSPTRPFGGWVKSRPTQSLGWYDAYNSVKHNREEEFHRATLRHAFEAVSACIALFVGQFGASSLSFELSVLVCLETPEWPISEMYLSPIGAVRWVPVKHPSI